MFQGKVVVITGGAQGIGRCIASEFEKQGATVCIIDRQPNAGYVGDISSEQVLRDFSEKVISRYGRVDCLINNAIPLSKGLDSCTYDEFNYALRVGITAPFFLTQLFMPYFAEGASIVNISSSRDRMSQPDTESYTAALQHPAGRVGNPLDIANMALFLCSDKAGFITGENICIDGGMTRQMIYHDDYGWALKVE